MAGLFGLLVIGGSAAAGCVVVRGVPLEGFGMV